MQRNKVAPGFFERIAHIASLGGGNIPVKGFSIRVVSSSYRGADISFQTLGKNGEVIAAVESVFVEVDGSVTLADVDALLRINCSF